ncbi:hypothetical protein NIES267_55050 [Calothrix parasitica NIES-267]|uniref:Uncharacterized protein n=1 Tax=Calothrix parasitica NIES-267 TaxID=1973488 RepID=A0A1Z4LXQ4_9CYAN|nr:hypothetical protein NIES267_55050 [Calothrix parasitica NIES-267]
MTQNASKSILNWTEKHLKYCLKYRIKNVAQTLWKWLLTLGKENQKIEFTLQEFQQYVKKLQGKPHALHWVKQQFEKLVFLRIIHIDKDFGHNTYRIKLRHPDATIPKKRCERNLHYHQVTLEKQPSNGCHSETGFVSSSSPHSPDKSTVCTDDSSGSNTNNQPDYSNELNIKEHHRKLQIIKACAKYGILFNPKKATTEEIYKYPIEDITASLKLFKQRNKGGLIDNPQGWLIDCLRYRYYEDNLYTKETFIADIEDIFTSVFSNSG